MRTGPKGIYTQDHARQAYLLALYGVSEQAMAELWGIHINTLTDWKNSYPEFLQALRGGGILANVKVAEHFFLNCIDRYVDDEEIHVWKGEIMRVPVRRFIQGDKWAQSRWLALKNRENWSEIQRIQIDQTNININKIDLSCLTNEELMLYKKLHQQQLSAHIDLDKSGN
jgi:hypothetical protein